MTSRPQHVDFVFVSLATTLGWVRTNEELVVALRALGRTVEVVKVDAAPWRARLGRFGWVSPLLDLAEAAAARRSVGVALKRVSSEHLIYASTTTALLEPRSRRRRGILRFDDLARSNRPGPRNWILRGLERVTLRSVVGAWPMAPLVAPLGARTASICVLPPIVRSEVARGEKIAGQAFCYVNGPKKRLGLVLDAWAQRGDETGSLVVAGMDREGLLALLPVGAPLPPGVRFAGPLSAEGFRALAAESEIFVAAPVYEDFGVAPLEALAAGCLMVTTPSPGSYAARRIVETVDAEMVGREDSAVALARALRHARQLEPKIRKTQVDCLRAEVAQYSEESFRTRLVETLIDLDRVGR